MRPTRPLLRPALAVLLAAGLLAACEPDSPELPEAPPAQDGTVEEPDPEAVDQLEVDPEEVEAD